MEIKPDTLQIGDWVSYDGDPVRVTAIYGNGDASAEGNDVSVISDRFDTLPLTVEILERLGRGRFGNAFCFANSQTVIFVFLEGGLFRFHTNEVDGCYMYGAFPAHFHMLQHAMRLCGFNADLHL